MGRVETTGDLSPLQKDLVNYVFKKARATWPMQYDSQFADIGYLTEFKREWAVTIIKAVNCGQQDGEGENEWVNRAIRRINQVFDDIRRPSGNKNDVTFLDFSKICGYFAKFVTQPAHREYVSPLRLTDQGAQDRAKAAHDKEMARLRDML